MGGQLDSDYVEEIKIARERQPGRRTSTLLPISLSRRAAPQPEDGIGRVATMLKLATDAGGYNSGRTYHLRPDSRESAVALLAELRRLAKWARRSACAAGGAVIADLHRFRSLDFLRFRCLDNFSPPPSLPQLPRRSCLFKFRKESPCLFKLSLCFSYLFRFLKESFVFGGESAQEGGGPDPLPAQPREGAQYAKTKRASSRSVQTQRHAPMSTSAHWRAHH